MGKYIWPGDVTKAARWYLELLRETVQGVSLDEFMRLVASDHPSRNAAYARLQRLQKNGLVTRAGQGHNLTYQISRQGLSLLETITFTKLDPPKQWDGHWRIVIFDVPEYSSEARLQIRRLLKELGFTKLQLSVWIHPLSCLEQFEQLRKAYGITEHIFLIETHAFAPPQDIISRFQKQYPTLNFNK